MYSQTTPDDVKYADCLIINTIGILSSVYRYADIAYIGGGFGVGIHNILEAAVYGIPVVFGPNYHKFKEAIDLVAEGGAFTVKEYSEVEILFNKLLSDKEYYTATATKSAKFVQERVGATPLIMEQIFERI